MKSVLKLGVLFGFLTLFSLPLISVNAIAEGEGEDDTDTPASLMAESFTSAFEAKALSRCDCDESADDADAEVAAFRKCITKLKSAAVTAATNSKALLKYSGSSLGAVKSALNAEIADLVQSCEDSMSGGDDDEEEGGEPPFEQQ